MTAREEYARRQAALLRERQGASKPEMPSESVSASILGDLEPESTTDSPNVGSESAS